MTQVAWSIALGVLLVIETALIWQTVRPGGPEGPSLPDRLLTGTAATNILSFVLLVAAMLGESELYFDAVLAAALLSFSGTIFIGKWISTGRVL